MMILLVAFGVAEALCVYLLIRNPLVRDFRLRLIAQVQDCADRDTGRPWTWRYATFDAVSYERMLFSFRRLRAENYYPDLAFLRVER